MAGSKACSAAAPLPRRLKSRKTRSLPAKVVVANAVNVASEVKAVVVTVNAEAATVSVVVSEVNAASEVKAVAVMVKVATKPHAMPIVTANVIQHATQPVMHNAKPRAVKAARQKATTNAADAAAMVKAVAVSATVVLKAKLKPKFKPMT